MQTQALDITTRLIKADAGACVQLLKVNLLSNLLLSVVQQHPDLEDQVCQLIQAATCCEHRPVLLTVSQDFKAERNRLRMIAGDIKDVTLKPETR